MNGILVLYNKATVVWPFHGRGNIRLPTIFQRVRYKATTERIDQ